MSWKSYKEQWRIWFWWRVLRVLGIWVPFQDVTLVGNRFIRRGNLVPLDVTIIQRDTREPDGYERTELLRMMYLIRTEEERQQWTVPEPHNCIYCSHVSPAEPNGHCPVIKYGKEWHHDNPVPAPCLCFHHQKGLEEGLRQDIDAALEKRQA